MQLGHDPWPSGWGIREVALGAVLAWAFLAVAADAPPEFVRQMNLGKANLENRSSAKAITAFESAVKLSPKSAPAWRNLARAQMLANLNDEAFKSLATAQELEKDSAATIYLMALVRAHQTRFEDAVPLFEEAVRLDPNSAVLRFQLANAYQVARRPSDAVKQLKETVRLDPLHAAAHFKLAGFAAQAEDLVEAQKRQTEFMRLRKIFADDTRTPAALERCAYTQPESVPASPTRILPGIKAQFADASAEAFADDSVRAATAAAVLEVDEQGTCSVFTVAGQGTVGLLTMNPAGKFVRSPISPSLAGTPVFFQCVVGDFHDEVPKGTKYDPTAHARNDVWLVSTQRVFLLKSVGTNAFEDVTAKAGLTGAAGRRAAWVDYDHDGDVDLLIAAEAGLQLWQNNGDGRFSNETKAAGLEGGPGACDIAAADLDNNVAIDLIIARGDQPTTVFANQRAGQFAKMPEPPGPWPPARRVLADDLDNDGNPDALLIGEKEAVVLFGRRAARQSFDLSMLDATVGVLVDFDNDGWLDVLIAGAQRGAADQGAVRLWRNPGNGNWMDATEPTGLTALRLPPVRDVVVADLDHDGDTDLLLVTTANRLHFLRNNGGNTNGQLKLRLIGLKTNPGGLGTRVEVRAGELRVVRTVSGLPIEIGLGQKKQLDSLLTVWGNGVVDNQIEIAVKPAPLNIAEKNVAAGSCPYLYAWDGRGFRFVTDLLGNSPLGLSVRRGTVMPADPDEIVLVGNEKNFRPRRGYYEIEVTEELREVLYLDTARLIAVDRPPEVEVHSTDKLCPPPFPASELWALQSPRVPVSALGDDGVDRTAAVRVIDGVFAPPGPPLPPPLRGLTHPLALTLDFGPLDINRPLVLALTGWIQYGDASANIASSQNESLTVIPPKLEVETPDGAWRAVDVVVGMPAGKTKTMLVDLTGKLPSGARRLRLMTTFELRWDRIALCERGSATELKQRELAPASARLYWRGFSEINSRAPGHPQTPAFDAAKERPPWGTTPQGWCTAYGNVLDLVTARDERLVLLNAGDSLNLRFKAHALPPVPTGQERTFFFYSVGWDKDADYNVVDGDRVEPLPVAAKGDWLLKTATRWVPADRFTR